MPDENEKLSLDPPSEWELDAYRESPEDGWCSTRALARKLQEIAECK